MAADTITLTAYAAKKYKRGTEVVRLVDSHCHLNMLDLSDYNNDLSSLIHATHDAGIESMLCIGVDLASGQQVIDIAQAHPQVFASVGVHPCDVIAIQPTYEQIMQLAQADKVVAIGETGLDFYYPGSDTAQARSKQQEYFAMHIDIAAELGKPLVIHTRSAAEETIACMQQHEASRSSGVMHCFTESWEMAKQALDLGFYISISGIVTFKNAKQVAAVAQKVPLDRLLIETDAPYLAPVPFRGKQNQPAYVRYVAQHVAQLRNITEEALAEATSENFYRLFSAASIPSANA